MTGPDDLTAASRPAARPVASVIAWILLLALALRLGLALTAWLLNRDPAVFTAPDTSTYLVPARELAAYGTFTTHGAPELIRTPGYPLLMVPGVLAGNVTAVTIALQIGLSLVTCVGVFLLGLELTGDRRVALAGAGIAAVEPLGVQYSAILLSEGAFTALVVLALVALARHARRATPASLAAGTVLLCAAAYVRPAGYLLPFAVATFFALYAAFRRRWRAVAWAAAAGVLAFGLFLPWKVRNAAAGYPGFSAVVPYSVYFYNAAAVLAHREGISQQEQQARMGWLSDSVYFRLHPEQRAWPVARRLAYMEREGRRIVRADPGALVRSHARGVASAALGTGAGEFRSLMGIRPPPGTILQRLRAGGAAPVAVVPDVLGMLFLGAVYLLSGFWLVRRFRRLTAAWILVLATAAYMLAIAGGVGGARFRVPAMPLLCVTAGAGAVLLLRRRAPSPRTPRDRSPEQSRMEPDPSAIAP